jgi:lipopolysaccharide export system protein LptA
MAKTVDQNVQDAALNDIKNNANKLVVLSAQATTYAEANATFMLANVVIASGDFTLAAGDVSGRKVTIGAKNTISVSVSGTATHIAVIDTTNSRVKSQTTCTSQAINTGGTVDVPSYKVLEVQNPT